YFSETGQLWGNPIYRWPVMRRLGFQWWIDRFRGTFRLFDIVRVDHFRGFESYWSVSAREKTAINGKWVKAPGRRLFRELKKSLGDLNIVAENLGVITPEVEALRREFGFPGMAVLQFAFGSDPQAASFQPHRFERHLFAYTGTHDNDTLMGWWNGEGNSTRSREQVRHEKAGARRYLGFANEPVNWAFIRLLSASVADAAIVPMQDVLGLNGEARMNLPGNGSGNWRWRMLPGAFTPALQAQLRDLAENYGRITKHDARE
ncbi:MAG: 4-alpha-glucanotransferase, partial [Bryobacteraceae bacterium]